MNKHTDFRRITIELASEDASIWYVIDPSFTKIVLKAPSNVIKSIMQGCEVFFFFAKDITGKNIYLHNGVRIMDDEVRYMNILGTNRFFDEHYALQNIMRANNSIIDFYNELGIWVASAEVSIDAQQA